MTDDLPEKYHTVSFIIPTLGRESLQKTLDSIELWDGDEIIVVRNNGEPKGWGGRERTEGIKKAKCDFLSFMDDDDWYLPGTRWVMHNAMEKNPYKRPILFRMRYPSGRILWEEPKFRNGNFGTPMIFVPNIKEMLPVWDDRRSADFHFVNGFGWPHRKIIWRPEIICQLGHEDALWEIYQRNLQKMKEENNG